MLNLKNKFATDASSGELGLEWSRERAFRIGQILTWPSLALSFCAAGLDYAFSSREVFYGDILLILGCITTIYLTKRNAKKRHFYWGPIYTAYWVAINLNLLASGGIKSPLLGTFMTLLFVAGVVVQNRVKAHWILASVVLNLIGLVLSGAHRGALTSVPYEYLAFMNTACLVAVGICIYGFLRTEAKLAREFGQRYRELFATKENLSREEAANAAKSTFLANVSHELRTPLGAILGYVELLQNGENRSKQEALEYLSIVRRNGQQLTRLVDDLLDLSKVEAGRLELEKLKFPLENLFREIMDIFGLAADNKGIKLSVEYLTPIPSHVSTDPVRLKQVIVNLISNAIKFTAQGEVRVKVSYVPGDGLAGCLKVAVQDSGRGLTKAEQEKLFQPFSQADATMSRKYGGTGLGLNLSRKLAQLLGGGLEITFSEKGVGSTFSLTAKLERLEGSRFLSKFSAFDVIKKVEATDKNKPAAKELEGIRILVVDDTADNRSLLRKFLEPVGAVVETANDGAQGIHMAMQTTYDIVLMDIQMPGVDGLQATSVLRQNNFRKPIIALTAHAMKQDRDRCLEAGCTEHLAKPVRRNELVSKIKELTHQPSTNPPATHKSREMEQSVRLQFSSP